MNYIRKLFDDIVPNTIKFSAVFVAIPRLVITLLRSEGFELPISWLIWWIPVSALFGVGLAVIEGLSFAYILNQWKNEKDQQRSKILFSFAVVSLLTFCFMIAPSIAASVMDKTLKDVLVNPFALGVWSFLVVFAPTIIIASVGYAQKSNSDKKSPHQNKKNIGIRKNKVGRPKKIVGEKVDTQ